MLRVVLNKSRKQHPTKQKLYGLLLPITQTIQVRQTRYAGHCWRSKAELLSNVLLWTSIYVFASVSRPARSYIHQLCANNGFSVGDLPGEIDDRDGWQKRFRELRAMMIIIMTYEFANKWALSRLKMLPPNYSLTNYIYIYIYKHDLALNNRQRLICHKT